MKRSELRRMIIEEHRRMLNEVIDEDRGKVMDLLGQLEQDINKANDRVAKAWEAEMRKILGKLKNRTAWKAIIDYMGYTDARRWAEDSANFDEAMEEFELLAKELEKAKFSRGM